MALELMCLYTKSAILYFSSVIYLIWTLNIERQYTVLYQISFTRWRSASIIGQTDSEVRCWMFRDLYHQPSIRFPHIFSLLSRSIWMVLVDLGWKMCFHSLPEHSERWERMRRKIFCVCVEHVPPEFHLVANLTPLKNSPSPNKHKHFDDSCIQWNKNPNRKRRPNLTNLLVCSSTRWVCIKWD